ncbi:hypothetical protein M1146_07440 [Patescibacteria group bacterium]|nr:hypothetical protein [Patescibacteria group bacterium]
MGTEQITDKKKRDISSTWGNPEWRRNRIAQMKGHSVSDETKEKIGAANKGNKHTKEYRIKSSLERGGIMVKAYHLLLRNGLIEEICQITGFERTQIQDLRDALRDSKVAALKKPTREEESKTKSAAYHYRRKIKSQGGYTPVQMNSFALARELNNAGFFTDDLTIWNELKRSYQERDLPQDFADRLRLEAYIKAAADFREGNQAKLNEYVRITTDVDKEWLHSPLSEELGFIDPEVSAILGAKVLLIHARRVLGHYEAQPLKQLLEEKRVGMPENPLDQEFLETFYGIRIAVREQRLRETTDSSLPKISLDDLEPAYSFDHEIFDRLGDQIATIRDSTTAIPKLPRSGTIFDVSRLDRAQHFYSENGVPKSNR